MSVLNQMLRDLEKRGATPALVAAAGTATVARPALAAEPRAVDVRRRWAWTGVLAIGALFVGVHSWLSWRVQDAGTARTPLGAQQFAGVLDAAPKTPAAPAALAPQAPNTAAVAPAPVAATVATPVTQTATAAPQSRPAPATPRVAAAAPAPAATLPRQSATPKPDLTDAAKPIAAEVAAPGRAPAPAIVAPSSNALAADVDRAAELIARGRSTEAMELLAQVLARQPTHAAARGSLAALLAEAGRREQALHVLLAGSELDAARFAAPAAQLQAELGNVTGALATLARLPPATRTPAHEALYAGLAQRAGDHMTALAAYRRALAQPQADPVWWVGLGVSLEATGEPGEARGAYARAAADARLPADVRRYVSDRLAVLQSARDETSRASSLANVF